MDTICSMKAEIFKALGHPIRLRIVELVADGEKTVTELVEAMGAEPSNTSRHLAVLKRVGIVSDRKEGLNVYYRLELPCVAQFFACVTDAVKEKLQKSESLLKELV
jgi:DNA-binding transcriptional ArsR family regulator